MELMHISGALTDETRLSIEAFNSSPDLSGPALFSYSGTLYKWLDPWSLTEDQLEYANESCRILSGLYGFLRPLDIISPYRLEMKTPLSNMAGRNLYPFWIDKITKALADENRTVLSLASDEYTRALRTGDLNMPFISVRFKERKGDRLRTVGMYSKMARGKMAGMILRDKTEDHETLKNWNIGGYVFDESFSSDKEWVYTGNWRGDV